MYFESHSTEWISIKATASSQCSIQWTYLCFLHFYFFTLPFLGAYLFVSLWFPQLNAAEFWIKLLLKYIILIINYKLIV